MFKDLLAFILLLFQNLLMHHDKNGAQCNVHWLVEISRDQMFRICVMGTHMQLCIFLKQKKISSMMKMQLYLHK